MEAENLQKKARRVHEILLAFYGEPEWRTPFPPIAELVSTILSQNTNDRNRDAAYDALTRRYPTWEQVRDADPQELVSTIRIAGLANQKGPRIQTVLHQITTERGSLDLGFLAQLPPEDVRAWLLRFVGVGPKTTAIVMQFSLDMPAFPVDTHVYRVTQRLGLTPVKTSVEQAHPYLEGLFQPENFKTDHLNIIRLGREICAARLPRCTLCPLQHVCDYFQQNLPHA